VNILGIPMLIRIHGRDTNGVLSAVESHDVPGGGPPPHIHQREDETFQILEGEYEWMVGDTKFIAQKGTTIPRRALKASSRKLARSVRHNSRTSRGCWRLRGSSGWKSCRRPGRDVHFGDRKIVVVKGWGLLWEKVRRYRKNS
jgi:hypothetical protein